jgi:hypothetical protein
MSLLFVAVAAGSMADWAASSRKSAGPDLAQLEALMIARATYRPWRLEDAHDLVSVDRADDHP